MSLRSDLVVRTTLLDGFFTWCRGSERQPKETEHLVAKRTLRKIIGLQTCGALALHFRSNIDDCVFLFQLIRKYFPLPDNSQLLA